MQKCNKERKSQKYQCSIVIKGLIIKANAKDFLAEAKAMTRDFQSKATACVLEDCRSQGLDVEDTSRLTMGRVFYGTDHPRDPCTLFC